LTIRQTSTIATSSSSSSSSSLSPGPQVTPDVRAGDQLDIRPYVKLKVIPGGQMHECGYVDGLVFRKNVAHKKMLRDIEHPRYHRVITRCPSSPRWHLEIPEARTRVGPGRTCDCSEGGGG
jgi:hypothetical protein